MNKGDSCCCNIERYFGEVQQRRKVFAFGCRSVIDESSLDQGFVYLLSVCYACLAFSDDYSLVRSVIPFDTLSRRLHPQSLSSRRGKPHTALALRRPNILYGLFAKHGLCGYWSSPRGEGRDEAPTGVSNKPLSIWRGVGGEVKKIPPFSGITYQP